MFSKLSQDLNKASKSRYSFETISQHYLQTSFIFLLVYGRGSFTVLCFSLFCPRLQLSTQTYLGPVYKERGLSLCQGYGCVENKDLRPPPPSKSLINIQKRVSRPQMCKRQQYLQLCKISTRVFVFYTIPPVCRKRRPPSKSLGNGWKLLLTTSRH